MKLDDLNSTSTPPQGADTLPSLSINSLFSGFWSINQRTLCKDSWTLRQESLSLCLFRFCGGADGTFRHGWICKYEIVNTIEKKTIQILVSQQSIWPQHANNQTKMKKKEHEAKAVPSSQQQLVPLCDKTRDSLLLKGANRKSWTLKNSKHLKCYLSAKTLKNTICFRRICQQPWKIAATMNQCGANISSFAL